MHQPWLPNHLKMLKRWRNDATLESEESKKCSPGYLVYHYELTIMLIEAAWLLKRHKLGRLESMTNRKKISQNGTSKRKGRSYGTILKI